MNLPLNGRVAIIDDQFRHAQPIIQILSKKQLPHTYFSGELKYLPEEGQNSNDIRLLFLDINLIDDSEHENKVLKAKLLPVLNRVISPTNYPYVIVLWSRHEHHRSLLEDDIFRNELKHKAPIGYVSADKYNFFNLDGERQDDFDEKIEELFEKVNSLIEKFPSYNYLLKWENIVHTSTDKTLQDVFKTINQSGNWEENANYLINKFGSSYLGAYFKTSTNEQKIKASYQAFNSVFLDTLESISSTNKIDNAVELKYDGERIDIDNKYYINKKLLVVDDKIFNYPGSIIEDKDVSQKSYFNDLLAKSLSSNIIRERVKAENKGAESKAINQLVFDELKLIRENIRKKIINVHCFVTPLCDFIQKNNHKFDRAVSGIIISNENRQYIDDKHESIFISPSFEYNAEFYFLILDFRCFHTNLLTEGEFLRPLFRVRQQLLAEIQSKLARHISRQGILFID